MCGGSLVGRARGGKGLRGIEVGADMIDGPYFVLTVLGLLGTAVVAGVFCGFSTFVMKGLASLPPAQGVAAMQAIKDTADRGEMAYDQMIGEDNPEGNALVQAAIDALLDQTRTIEKIVVALDLGPLAFEGSDSLDAPEAVFQ